MAEKVTSGINKCDWPHCDYWATRKIDKNFYCQEHLTEYLQETKKIVADTVPTFGYCDTEGCLDLASYRSDYGYVYCAKHWDITVDVTPKPLPDMINAPPHYQSPSGLEAIDVIEAFELDYYRACAVKYILRCGKKGGDRAAEVDLKKAIWYLKRKIQHDRMPVQTWVQEPKQEGWK